MCIYYTHESSLNILGYLVIYIYVCVCVYVYTIYECAVYNHVILGDPHTPRYSILLSILVCIPCWKSSSAQKTIYATHIHYKQRCAAKMSARLVTVSLQVPQQLVQQFWALALSIDTRCSTLYFLQVGKCRGPEWLQITLTWSCPLLQWTSGGSEIYVLTSYSSHLHKYFILRGSLFIHSFIWISYANSIIIHWTPPGFPLGLACASCIWRFRDSKMRPLDDKNHKKWRTDSAIMLYSYIVYIIYDILYIHYESYVSFSEDWILNLSMCVFSFELWLLDLDHKMIQSSRPFIINLWTVASQLWLKSAFITIESPKKIRSSSMWMLLPFPLVASGAHFQLVSRVRIQHLLLSKQKNVSQKKDTKSVFLDTINQP